MNDAEVEGFEDLVLGQEFLPGIEFEYGDDEFAEASPESQLFASQLRHYLGCNLEKPSPRLRQVLDSVCEQIGTWAFFLIVSNWLETQSQQNHPPLEGSVLLEILFTYVSEIGDGVTGDYTLRLLDQLPLNTECLEQLLDSNPYLTSGYYTARSYPPLVSGMSRHLIDRVLEEIHAEIASDEHSWDHPFALISLALYSEADEAQVTRCMELLLEAEPFESAHFGEVNFEAAMEDLLWGNESDPKVSQISEVLAGHRNEDVASAANAAKL